MGEIAESFVWPLIVVTSDPFGSHAAHLTQSVKDVAVEDLLAVSSVKAFNEADTVEAIASHRPYRAGMGIDRAVAEVCVRSGTLFDCDVVEECRKLYKRGELTALLAGENSESASASEAAAQLRLAVSDARLTC